TFKQFIPGKNEGNNRSVQPTTKNGEVQSERTAKRPVTAAALESFVRSADAVSSLDPSSTKGKQVKKISRASTKRKQAKNETLDSDTNDGGGQNKTALQMGGALGPGAFRHESAWMELRSLRRSVHNLSNQVNNGSRATRKVETKLEAAEELIGNQAKLIARLVNSHDALHGICETLQADLEQTTNRVSRLRKAAKDRADLNKVKDDSADVFAKTTAPISLADIDKLLAQRLQGSPAPSVDNSQRLCLSQRTATHVPCQNSYVHCPFRKTGQHFDQDPEERRHIPCGYPATYRGYPCANLTCKISTHVAWRKKQGRQNDEGDESCEKIGHLSEAKPKVKLRLPKGKQKTKNPPPKFVKPTQRVRPYTLDDGTEIFTFVSSKSEYEEENEREESDYSDEDSDAMHRNRLPPQKLKQQKTQNQFSRKRKYSAVDL
ncbi:unnamed protein product, partial [Aphanomyces euteiches]